MSTKQQNAAVTRFDDLLSLDLSHAGVQLCLASVQIEDQAVPELEKVQLSNAVATRFSEIAAKNIWRLRKLASKGDLRLVDYDASAMNRPEEVEFLELSALPDVSVQVAALHTISNMPVFAADEAFVEGLKFYVIMITLPNGAVIHFLRWYTPKNELSRSSHFGLRLSRTVYDEVREPIFLFDESIDCIAIDGHLFIFSKDRFQKIFRYFERLREAGREALKSIASKVKIHNFDALAAFCEGHLQKMAKLRNIASKPYLEFVTMADIKRVIKQFDLPLKTIRKDGEERLLFDPEDKDKWLVLRILDDDYLGSVMTKLKYEANSKRQVNKKI